jgi:hypothetical protein
MYWVSQQGWKNFSDATPRRCPRCGSGGSSPVGVSWWTAWIRLAVPLGRQSRSRCFLRTHLSNHASHKLYMYVRFNLKRKLRKFAPRVPEWDLKKFSLVNLVCGFSWGKEPFLKPHRLRKSAQSFYPIGSPLIYKSPIQSPMIIEVRCNQNKVGRIQFQSPTHLSCPKLITILPLFFVGQLPFFFKTSHDMPWSFHQKSPWHGWLIPIKLAP